MRASIIFILASAIPCVISCVVSLTSSRTSGTTHTVSSVDDTTPFPVVVLVEDMDVMAAIAKQGHDLSSANHTVTPEGDAAFGNGTYKQLTAFNLNLTTADKHIFRQPLPSDWAPRVGARFLQFVEELQDWMSPLNSSYRDMPQQKINQSADILSDSVITNFKNYGYDIRGLVINAPDPTLWKRVEGRTDDMVANLTQLQTDMHDYAASEPSKKDTVTYIELRDGDL